MTKKETDQGQQRRNKTILLFLFLLIAYKFIIYIGKSPELNLPHSLLTGSEAIITALGAFLVVSVILRLTSKRVFTFFEGDVEIEQRIFLTKLYSIVLYAAAIFFVFYRSGVSVTNIAYLATLLATGIAFAVRDIIMSWAVWFILLNKKPFRIGDHIRIGEDSGKVERIGTIFVTLLGEEPGTSLKIPNKAFLDKNVLNYGPRGVLDSVKMPLHEVPSDVEIRLAKLEKELAKIVGPGAHVVFLTESGRPMVNALYYAKSGMRSSARNKAFGALRRAFKGIPNL